MKHEIKTEMKNRILNDISVNELSIFVFNKTEYANLDWEDEKEFRFNGEMYDIVKVEFISNTDLRVYCIEDKKEKTLFSIHEKQVQNNSSESTDGKHSQKVIKIISNYFFQTPTTNFFIPEKQVLLGLRNKTSFNSFIGEIPSPPPKSV